MPPGSKVRFGVRLQRNIVGNFTSTVTIASSDPQSPFTFTFTVHGVVYHRAVRLSRAAATNGTQRDKPWKGGEIMKTKTGIQAGARSHIVDIG